MLCRTVIVVAVVVVVVIVVFEEDDSLALPFSGALFISKIYRSRYDLVITRRADLFRFHS